MVFMLLYGMWLARNDAKDSKEIEDPRAIVSRTVVAMEESCDLHNHSTSGSARMVEH
jgi:hypothetical protein